MVWEYENFYSERIGRGKEKVIWPSTAFAGKLFIVYCLLLPE